MGAPMLTVEHFAAGRGAIPAARLSGLTVASGQAALLLGPSGAGKTTLLLAMAGLARVFTGEARIDGVVVADLAPAAQDRFRGRNIGFIFQDIHLIPGLSLLDNLLLSPFAAGVAQDRKRALSLLDALGLGDKASRPAERLSRGEAQRAAIARAMLMSPKLILADEPTASLDDETCESVASLLLSAATETGAALLIATHDQRLRNRIPAQAVVEAAQ
jgi:ABC-type lipoprotein export system ATPase subunit